jgi:hypothetical protein
MVLSVLVKYWCIYHYYKSKGEYIELRVMKVVLIRVVIGKK